MAELNDASLMSIGKYQGTPMTKVPDRYLMDIWDRHKQKHKLGKLVYSPLKQIMRYIEDNLDAIKSNLNQ